MMYARKLAIVAGVICALAATTAYANNITAQEFVTKASVANKFEIDSSTLALQKSQDGGVQAFAKRIIKDHTATGQKLQAVIGSSSSHVALADGLDSNHQKLMNTLESSTGAQFDQQYVAIQTDAHKQAVMLFERYAKHGKDSALKDFAKDTLPTLKEHLQHVQQLKTN